MDIVGDAFAGSSEARQLLGCVVWMINLRDLKKSSRE